MANADSAELAGVPWSAVAPAFATRRRGKRAARHRYGRRSGGQTPELEHALCPAKALSPLRFADALHTTRQLVSERPMECGGKRSATPLWASKRRSNTRIRARVLPGESVVAATLCRHTPYPAATRVRTTLGVRGHPPALRFGAASAQRDTAVGAETSVKHPNKSTRSARRKRRRRYALPMHSIPRGNSCPNAPWSAGASAARQRYGRRSGFRAKGLSNRLGRGSAIRHTSPGRATLCPSWALSHAKAVSSLRSATALHTSVAAFVSRYAHQAT